MNGTATNPQARIAYLEEQLQALQDEYDLLRMELGQNLKFPSVLRLTRSQSVVLGVIMAMPVAYTSTIMAALYADQNDEPESPPDALIKVFVCQIRKKLRPFGMAIETVFATGYRMGYEDKRKIHDLLATEKTEKIKIRQEVLS